MTGSQCLRRPVYIDRRCVLALSLDGLDGWLVPRGFVEATGDFEAGLHDGGTRRSYDDAFDGRTVRGRRGISSAKGVGEGEVGVDEPVFLR